MSQTRDYTSNSQQSVFDVALMHYGSVAGLLYLFTDNPELIGSDGIINQFSVQHKIQKSVAVNEAIKQKMLILVPCSEGNKAIQSDWVTDDFQPWITDDNQTWTTET